MASILKTALVNFAGAIVLTACAAAAAAADYRPEKPKHWAFVPPQRPVPPPVRRLEAVRNPIDQFIIARLEREGIPPSPEADRAALVRRVTLDLTGLPPTPRDLDEFLADARPDAYERLVDRLLASPRYGERWGRWWLDAARYADSNGYSIDAPRQVWKYRDWVVNALNRDMPFDQFAIEQIAGDLLPNATVEQKIATGFHRNTQINQEGGIDPEQFRMRWLLALGTEVFQRCHEAATEILVPDPVRQHARRQRILLPDDPFRQVEPGGRAWSVSDRRKHRRRGVLHLDAFAE